MNDIYSFIFLKATQNPCNDCGNNAKNLITLITKDGDKLGRIKCNNCGLKYSVKFNYREKIDFVVLNSLDLTQLKSGATSHHALLQHDANVHKKDEINKNKTWIKQLFVR